MSFDWLTGDALTALVQVLVIDIVLAGDNAVVVGMAAAGLPREQRGTVILIGILAATVLRIVFAAMTTQLLQIIGLLFAGGILLLWVCWKMWRELREGHESRAGAAALDEDAPPEPGEADAPPPRRKTMREATTQIVLADVSMSLDNVLAVAGAARDHPEVLVIGLVLSVALMGLAATIVARLLNKYPWVAYVGLAIILYVAGKMIYEGAMEIMHAAA